MPEDLQDVARRFQQNLQHCSGTAAVFAVVEDACDSGQIAAIDADMTMALLAQLAVLDASESETVRIMRRAGHDWVWRDATPERVIELVDSGRKGDLSWKHTSACRVHFQSRAKGWDMAGMLAIATHEVTVHFDDRDRLLCVRETGN